MTNSTYSNEATDYRYPGSRPFLDTDYDRRLFFGRPEETQAFLNLVLAERLVVLFAKSGLGKTSLLNAGVLQPLRERGFLPFKIRFNNPDVDPIQNVYKEIEAVVQTQHIEYLPGDQQSLWSYFHTVEFWSAEDTLLTPVLILDQFEEFFTFYPPAQRAVFLTHAADLLKGRTPKAWTVAQLDEAYSTTPPKVKVILALREDYLGLLEEMAQELPEILQNRFRLLPLPRAQARQAIIEPAQLDNPAIGVPAFRYAPEAVEAMLDFLCKPKELQKTVAVDDIEPFQLQLLCQHVERTLIESGGTERAGVVIQEEVLGGETGMQRVLETFYDTKITELGSLLNRRRGHKLCEQGFISHAGRRLSLEEGDIAQRFHVSKDMLATLVDSRLLRAESRVGSMYYELSHDTLIDPIRKSQKKRQIRTWFASGVLMALLLVGATFQITEYLTLRRVNQSYTELRQHIFEHNVTETSKMYEKIIALEKRHVNTYIDTGQFYVQQKKFPQARKVYEQALTNNVKDGRIYYLLAQVLYEQENLVEAIPHYQRIIDTPDNPELQSLAYVGLGKVYRKQHNFAKAKAQYESALRTDHHNANVYKEFAILYIQHGQFEQALEQYQQVIGISPEYAGMYRELAEAVNLSFVDRPVRERHLEKLYEIATEVQNNDATYYFQLGEDFSGLGKQDKAIRRYEIALNKQPPLEGAYNRLIELLLTQGKIDKANEYAGQARTKLPDSALAHVVSGGALMKQKKYTEAMEQYQQALQIDPQSVIAYVELGGALRDQKKYEEAMIQYRKALNINPHNARVYDHLGFILKTQENYAEAKTQYQKAIEYDSTNACYYSSLGDVLNEQGEYNEAIRQYKQAIEVDPQSRCLSWVYPGLGRAFGEQKKYVEAAQWYQKATELEPHASNYTHLGLSWYYQGEYDKAAEAHQKALQLDPRHAMAYNNMGLVFEKQGKYDDALSQYQEAIDLDPHQVYPYRNRAKLFEKQGKYDQAILQYQKLIEAAPKHAVEAYKSVGDIYENQRHYDEAIIHYRKALELAPDNAKFYHAIGNALYDQQKYNEAGDNYLLAIKFDPKSATAYRNLGLTLYQQKQYADAIIQYQQALQLDPNLVDAYNDLGNALSKQKKYVEASDQYRKFIELSPTRARTYWNLGRTLYQQKQYADAIIQYQQALQLDPNLVDAYNDLGNALFKQKKYVEASDQYRKFIELSPTHAWAYWNLGRTLHQQKQYADAITQYQRALQLDPKDINVYNALGNAFYEQQQYDEAIAQYKKALEIDPQFAYAYNNLGNIALAQEQYEQAIKYHQEAIRLRPEPPFYLDLAKTLHRLKKYPEAIKSLETAIETDRDFSEAYLVLGAIYYDDLNNYPKAFATYKNAYQRHPEDRSIKMNFCEASLVAQDFAVAFTLANEVLKEADVPADKRFPMKFIAIASLFFQEKSSDALREVRTFIEEYKAFPTTEEKTWSYKGSKNFIKISTSLSETDKALLLAIVDLLESSKPEGDRKLKALEASLKKRLKK